MSSRAAIFACAKLRWVPALLAAIIVAACGESVPVQVVTLQVTGAGGYVLQGKSVQREELKHELKAASPNPAAISLHIAADPAAEYRAVGEAMQAAQYAGIARVSFVTEAPVK